MAGGRMGKDNIGRGWWPRLFRVSSEQKHISKEICEAMHAQKEEHMTRIITVPQLRCRGVRGQRRTSLTEILEELDRTL